MSKFLIAFLLFVCFCFAVQYSLRIQALGTDFAYLIPDYETDLYNNPNLLGKKLAGISYEPSLSTPLTIRVLTKRFGWFGNYWASYSKNWFSDVWNSTTVSISVNDLWMLDLRGKLPKFLASDVWNLYNDGGYDVIRRYYDQSNYETTRTINYILSVSGSYSIGKYIKIISKVCGGYYSYYKHDVDNGNELIIDQKQMIYTDRLGIYYRNAPTANRFTSFYLTVGGPVSVSEINQLPFPIFSHLRKESGLQQTLFAKTLIVQLGWAKGIPVNTHGFVAIGMRNVLLYQRTNTPDTSFIYPYTELRGLRNTLSFPIALEYNINKIAIRVGTRLYYTYRGDKVWNSYATTAVYNEHQLDFDYTLGLSWHLNDKVTIEVYNRHYLAQLDNWAIYLKYVH